MKDSNSRRSQQLEEIDLSLGGASLVGTYNSDKVWFLQQRHRNTVTSNSGEGGGGWGWARGRLSSEGQFASVI